MLNTLFVRPFWLIIKSIWVYSKYFILHYPVLITPPRIPTGFQNFLQKKHFYIFLHFLPTGLLLDSCWIPTGLQLNLNKYHKLKPMGQILDSYWIPTGVSYNLLLLTLTNLHKSLSIKSLSQSYLNKDIALIIMYITTWKSVVLV